MARPFFGTGVLGGYTTFSAFAVDILLLIRADRPAFAAPYLVGTLAGALLGATGGMVLARRPSAAVQPAHAAAIGSMRTLARRSVRAIARNRGDRLPVGGRGCSGRRAVCAT